MLLKKRDRALILRLYFSAILVLCQPLSAWSAGPPRFGIAFFGGPESPVPMVELARVRQFELLSYGVIGTAFRATVLDASPALAIDAETSLVKYLERGDLFSGNIAIAVRWLKTPWSRLIDSHFSFGNGLSYNSAIPESELTRLNHTSKLLYHFFLEFSFPFHNQPEWEAIFRIQHRSGAFGLFNGVVGGSDFFCLGMRYKFH